MNPPSGDVQDQPFALRRRSLAKLIDGRQHLLVAGSAWASRVVMALAQLAVIRVLIGSLGVEKYAMFALLMGLLQWYMLSDLGLGLSTQNRISACRARKQPYDAVIVIAGRIAIVLLVVSIVLLHFVSPYLAEHFLKAFPGISNAEKASNFFLTGALFIGAGIGNISYKIWYAEQRGYWAHLLPAVASVLGLIGLIILSHGGRQHSTWAAILIFNAPATLFPLGSLVLRVVGQPRAFRTLESALIKKTLLNAAKFWITTILVTAALQVDYLIISQILSPHQIVVYVVATKIFGFVAFFFTSLLWALWPKFAESVSCREWDKVRQLRANCLRLGAILVVGATIVLAFTMPYISEALAPGQAITIPLQMTLLLGVLQLARAWAEVYTVILQSMNMLWPFWIFIPIQMMLSAIFQYSLAPAYGTQGIVLGLIAALILTTTWGLPLVMKRYLERAQHQ
jgi:O-antigen/teichoic acid export membrane protein